jgi:exopolyphosphatase/pppGpp-phosphohydrolase
MKSSFYFDIGSSTIKLYEFKDELEQIEEKSIMFKKNFSEQGVSQENLKGLIDFIKFVKEKYNLNSENTEIFATGIWRKIPDTQSLEIKNKFKELDLNFNVISHEQENDYFEKAMYGNYNNKRVMMVNMGGKTTELVIFANNKVENKINLNVGVADVLTKFPNINDLNSNIKQEEIIDYIIDLLKDEKINTDCEIAIHTGGELRFQKLVKYNLQENKFFDDGIHKLYVTYEDFDKKNKELLYQTSLDELHSLMPQNPSWMDGAKAGIMLGQALFQKAKIKYIIPSDLNLIHGVIKEKLCNN